MTESKQSSAVADGNQTSTNVVVGKGAIVIIAVLGISVILFNVLIFLFVLSSQQSMDARETALNKREVVVQSMESRRDDLNREISGLMDQKAAAEQKAEDAEKQAADKERIESQRDKAEKQLQGARSKLADAEAQRDKVEARIASAQAIKASIQKDVAAGKDAVATAKKQVDALKTQINDLKNSRDAAQNLAEQAKSAASDAKQLEFDRDNTLNALKIAEAELSKKRSELSDVEAKSEKAIAEAKNAQQTAKSLSKENSKAQKERDNLKREISTLSSHLDNLKQQARTDEGVVSSLAAIKSQRDGAHADLTNLQTEIARLKVQDAALKAQIDAYNAQIATEKQVSSDIASKKEMLAQQTAKLNSVEQELQIARAEVARLKNYANSATTDKAAAKQAQQMRADAEKALSRKQGELNETGQEVADMQAQRASLSSEIKKLKLSVFAQNAAVTRAQQLRANVEKVLSDKQTELRRAKKDLARIEAERESPSGTVIKPKAGASSSSNN